MAHFRRYLREHERIQSTERSREGANPLFRLITEQRDGFRGSDIMGFLGSKSRMSELISETPSSPDLWLTIL